MEIFFVFVDKANELLGTLLVFGVGMAIPVAATLFVLDIAQSNDAIRRNYPLFAASPGSRSDSRP